MEVMFTKYRMVLCGSDVYKNIAWFRVEVMFTNIAWKLKLHVAIG